MFDIGFTELLLVGIVALLVLGPERLPEAIRTTSRLLHRLRTGFNTMKRELEREIGADELKRDLHNEAIMRQLKDGGDDLARNITEVRNTLSGLEYDVRQDAGDSPANDKP